MTPEMSVIEMLNSFIYIVKGSRVIDRTECDWGRFYYWSDERLVKGMVYSLSDIKRYFAHRVVKSKWESSRKDPFAEWFKHRLRLTQPTVYDAMRFAAMAARGEVEPTIDVDAMVKAAKQRERPPWTRDVTAA